MSYLKKAVKGFSIVFIINIIAAFIGYLIRIVLARNLTVEEYGLFFAVFTLINFLAIFKYFGLGRALVKYIPEFKVQKKLIAIKTAIVITLRYNLIFAIIIALLLVLFSKFLAIHYFNNYSAVAIIFLFSAIFIITVFKDILRTVFNALQKMLPFALMYLVENILLLSFLFLFFSISLDIFSAAYAYLAAFLLVFLVFLPHFLKSYPFFKFKYRYSANMAKKLFNFGLPSMLMLTGVMIILYTDTLLLTYYTSLENVGIYNIAVPTAMLLLFFSKSMGQVIFPMISELYSKKLNKYISKGVILLQKYTFVIISFLALVMFSFSGSIIKLFFGSEYLAGVPVLQLLALGMIFYVMADINMSVLSGLGKPKVSAKVIFIGAGVNLIANLFFIPWLGIIGAGITSLASYFIMFILSVILLTKDMRLKWPILNWLKTLFSVLIFVFAIYLLKKIITIGNVYIEAVIIIILTSAIYISMILILGVVDKNEFELFVKNFLLKNTKVIQKGRGLMKEK